MRTAVCVFVRDEERDFAEWLAYQLAVGFDAVLVYNNGSADRTPDIARAISASHDVRLTDWPMTGDHAQAVAYLDCITQFGRQYARHRSRRSRRWRPHGCDLSPHGHRRCWSSL